MTLPSDDSQAPDLTHRQEEILALIIRAYSQSPEPVSSKVLVEQDGLSVSSATIRNEMARLEELGLIAQPHTSAGRIPTEAGYRYFVKHLLGDKALTTAEEVRITEKLQTQPLATEQWMSQAATLLARTVQSAAVVTPLVAETSRFKHVELIAIQGRLVLMVLVLQQGSVHQQMLTLAEAVPQAGLSEAAARINGMCLDLSANDLRVRGVQLPLLEREIAELAADVIDHADSSRVRLVYRDGLSDVIGTFAHTEGAQQIVRVVEERALLNMILAELLSPFVNDVQVLIAGNGRWEELNQLSLVFSRYGIAGQSTGAVGVVGPTNMNYRRAISAVSYVSNVMSSMLAAAFDSPPASPASEAGSEDS
ncbi:MAG TPA: heat-inducible transcriptional repressor HrcA [Candidatus Limnocylindrales bacterium]|nr:heat-inducible transcriptional repressor HrcA [Candidatus Limnocylindrales bacterium]